MLTAPLGPFLPLVFAQALPSFLASTSFGHRLDPSVAEQHYLHSAEIDFAVSIESAHS